MKRIALTSIALIALAGAASAQTAADLSSASRVTLTTLAPDAKLDNLTVIQVREINRAVTSNDGLTQPELRTILAN